jgi:hypothetical protein
MFESYGRGPRRAIGVAFLALIPGLATAQPHAPTFTRDIAPVFQAKCEACHRPESMAPMPLVSYEDVRPWLRAIKQRVESRQMPPWHLDRTAGIQSYKNDRSLSDEQVATILRWIDNGAPNGDPRDLPAPKRWPGEQGWNFAATYSQKEPDLVITSTPYTQLAGAPDAWWKPVVPTGIAEPRWVRAIEIRPGTVKGRRVTHHALAYLRQSDTAEGLFMEWAVGKEGEIMRPDTGKLMLPGSTIGFDIHYSDGKEDITDVVELGVYFYPKGQEPKFRQSLGLYGGTRERLIDIPPHSTAAIEGFHVLQQPARLESFQPHMHLRGKGMSLEAIFADGHTEMLTSVSDFNFNWHNSYVYADDAAPLLPAGTYLKITSWHDNTASHKSNPDPSQRVRYGQRTIDEMAHAWINMTFMSDEDFKAEVERREKTRKALDVGR